jgi:hypothetical protein
VSACFSAAGGLFDTMACFDFSGWCGNIGSYCSSSGSWGNKWDCFNRNPPRGGSSPSATTSVGPCQATSTAKATTTTTTTATTCVPTPTGICTQPSSWTWGYKPGNPVGGIQLPVVTCNDLLSDFAPHPFKLYNSSDTSTCGRYPRSGLPSACSDACKVQYNQCQNTYAQGCKNNNGGGSIFSWWKRSDGNGAPAKDYFSFAKASPMEKRTITWSDTFSVATSKCQQQYNDCISTNNGNNGNGKCGTFGVGY